MTTSFSRSTTFSRSIMLLEGWYMTALTAWLESHAFHNDWPLLFRLKAAGWPHLLIDWPLFSRFIMLLDNWYMVLNVNVNVEVYSLKSPWVQQTLQFTPLVLELSLIRSHLLWGEFSAFSATDAIHNFSNFHSTRYPSLLGGQRRYGVRGFAQHLYTSINFGELGNWLIYNVLPLVWEIVRRTNRLGTRLCGSCMSTWRCHFWCTIVQPLLAVCLAVCGVALSPPGNEHGALAW